MNPVLIRVFASHPVITAHFTRLLSAEADFRLVSEDERPLVGVFDGELTSLQAVLTLARLKFPTLRPVLVGSAHNENECLRWLFRGVWGIVAYERYEEELPRAVREVAEGRLWLPGPVVMRWMRIDAARRDSALQFPLTRRQREVLELLFRRLSNREIADILNISERAVALHVDNILTKLQLSSRQELLAKLAPRLGLNN